MKYLIFSDIHGSAFYLEKIMDIFESGDFDKVLFLGDAIYHGPGNDLPYGYDHKKVIKMLNEMASKVEIISARGNCDSAADVAKLDFNLASDFNSIIVGDKKILLSHGHIAPKTNDYDVLLHGHTHLKENDVKEGILYLCPGSISIPRDETHSYATLCNNTFTCIDLLTGKKIFTREIK